MENKYDFILFENQQNARNHYKDVCIIARMLKECSYSVAIATLYEEEAYCKMDDIPLLVVKNKYKLPNWDWQKKPKNKIHSFYCTIRYLIQQYFYVRYFLKNIRGRANNLYVGSYHSLASTLLFREASGDCKIFFWGLRSSRISKFWANLKQDPFPAFRQLFLNPFVYKNNPNLCFFVSNEIIKKEFMDLGIDANRLVLREERTCEKIPSTNLDLKSDQFTLLSIGFIRKNKRIEMLIDAFKSIASKNDLYIIAGKTSDKYNAYIKLKIDGLLQIQRIDGYIDNVLYDELFYKCSYLILADKKEISSITNGTMLEALLHFRPIIAPNYLPYSYYINQFGIGILYNPDDRESLRIAIQKAKALPTDHFNKNIYQFLHTITFSESVIKFKKDITNAINQK